jgi:hypothetical protein
MEAYLNHSDTDSGRNEWDLNRKLMLFGIPASSGCLLRRCYKLRTPW